MKRRHITAGEPVIFDTRLCNYWVCCDCHLTHLVFMKRRGKYQIEVRMFRDNYETRKERKKK